MTKLNLKTAALRALIGFYRGLIHTIHFFGTLGRLFFRGAGGAIQKIFLPIVFLLYHFIFSVQRKIVAALRPVGSKVLFFISHRHIIHVAVFAIAVITGIGSLSMRIAHAEDLGTKSILYALVAGNSDETTQEESGISANTPSTAYLVDVVAVSGTPAIDFDYTDEAYVSAITGARAFISAPGEMAGTVAPLRTTIEKYVVKEGDTISSIADAYQISIVTLLAANKLTVRSYIRPGDALTILPGDGVQYVIKKGDTLEKIAKTYNADAHEIAVWNGNISEGSLAIGDQVFIPGGIAPTPRAPATRTLARFLSPFPTDIAAPPGGFINLWPTAVRRITQYFSWHHTGVDIAGPTGTPIYAADDGIVIHAGWSRGYGNNIVIDHGNGFKTRYGHSSHLIAKVGDQVKKGQVIELMGSTGHSTGPHLHFEVIQNGRFRNPFDFIH